MMPGLTVEFDTLYEPKICPLTYSLFNADDTAYESGIITFDSLQRKFTFFYTNND